MRPFPSSKGWMYTKPESQRGCCDDRIEGGCRIPVEGNHTVDQGRQVLGPSADVVGERRARVPLVLADKSALGACAQSHKSLVADHNLLQPEQFIEVDGLPPRLTDSPTPTLNAVLRRAFAFNCVTRLRLLLEQESGRAGQQVFRNRSSGRPGPLREIKVHELFEHNRAADERTEFRRARKVVPDAMPRGVLARDRPLLLRVDDRDIVAPCGIRQVQTLPGEPLVEKPETPGIAARGRFPDDGFDFGRIHREEEALQNGKIESLVLEGEGQVRFERGARGMAGREQAPAFLLQDPVALARGEQCPRQRNLQAVGTGQRSITGRRRPFRQPPVLKDHDRSWKTMSLFNLHETRCSCLKGNANGPSS